MIHLLKRRLKESLNQIKRVANIGNYWHWLEPNGFYEDIDIRSIVYPFRYDIIVRKDFFRFYEINKNIYNSDFSLFLKKSKSQPYYVWFVHIFIPRTRPRLIGNHPAIDYEYAIRVKASVKLYQSMKVNGLNLNNPILPITGEKILPSKTGIISSNKYFMGDGCHRLACLMVMGYRTVPKIFYRLKIYKQLIPLDNTTILSKHLKIEWDKIEL